MELLLFFLLFTLIPLGLGLYGLCVLLVEVLAASKPLRMLLNNVLLPVWSYDSMKLAYAAYTSGAIVAAVFNMAVALLFFLAIVKLESFVSSTTAK